MSKFAQIDRPWSRQLPDALQESRALAENPSWDGIGSLTIPSVMEFAICLLLAGLVIFAKKQ